MYVLRHHFAVHLKIKQYCKSTILLFKKIGIVLTPKYEIFVTCLSAIGNIDKLLFFPTIFRKHYHLREQLISPSFWTCCQLSFFTPKPSGGVFTFSERYIHFHSHDNKKQADAIFSLIYFIYILHILALYCTALHVCSVMSESLLPMDCSLPDSSVHGIIPGKNTGMGCRFLLQGIFPIQWSNCVSCISCIGRPILYHWANFIYSHSIFYVFIIYIVFMYIL